MATWLIIILMINVVLTILFLVWCYKKENKQAMVFAIFFLAVPILGILLFVIPSMLVKVIKHNHTIDAKDLISKTANEVYISRPKLNKELNVIPFDEALLVSSISEKRSFLLDILKNDMINNHKITKKALDDSDSETSHYAAAATMEVSKNLREQLQSIEASFMKEQTNGILRRAYIDTLYNYITIGILSERDKKINIDKYKSLIYDSMVNQEDILTEKDYANLITCHMELGELHEGEKIGLSRIEIQPSEIFYMQLLEIYYMQKNQVNFNRTLKELQNSKIVLSVKGLETVRFWLNKR